MIGFFKKLKGYRTQILIALFAALCVAVYQFHVTIPDAAFTLLSAMGFATARLAVTAVSGLKGWKVWATVSVLSVLGILQAFNVPLPVPYDQIVTYLDLFGLFGIKAAWAHIPRK